MKLFRYGKLGHEKPGMLDASGLLRDLSEHLVDLDPEHLPDETILKRLQALDIETLPVLDPSVHITACLNRPGKLVCVGLNSALHTRELGLNLMPKQDMLLFMKPTSAICGPHDPILYTRMMKKLDWEAELGIVIGKQGKYIQQEDARDYIHHDTAVVSYVSQYFTLYPGDIISMGSAPGNAKSWGEDQYLKPGDEVVLSIEGLGTQRQTVIHEP
ncbi:MAG: fumarylacetoacetate hydrolase family protein [Legionellaceae bacterium]|nr:fumarylacetoacetate hydrolase family protein [Legionellaceae bacterium]